MGNYTSYLTYSEETVPVSMEITDSDSEDTIVINRSYSDSTLEVMSESKREKLANTVGELELNNKNLENAISCIYLKNKMKTGFEKKINELTIQLHDTQDEVDDLHFLNSRLRHNYNRDISDKKQEIKILREQLGIMTLRLENLITKKNN